MKTQSWFSSLVAGVLLTACCLQTVGEGPDGGATASGAVSSTGSTSGTATTSSGTATASVAASSTSSGTVTSSSSGTGSTGGCVIGGQAFAARSLNPANLGQCCNPRTSPNAWLPLLTQGPVMQINGGPNDGVVEDFNGDGYPDVAVATSAPENVYAYLGIPDGGYAAPFVYQAGTWPIDLASGDMNGDGLPDLVVGSGDAVAVLLSQGDGSFGSAAVTPSHCRVGPLRVADVNQDGRNDVVATACGVGIFTNLGLVTGQVASEVDLSVGGQNNEVELLDLSGSGAPDLVVTANGGVVVALNDGGGGFPTLVTTSLSGAGGFAVASFSGGLPQVAVETGSSLALMSISASGDGTSLSQSSMDTFGQRAIALDLNGDGLPDVVTFGSNMLGISINLGNGAFANAVDLPVGPGPFVQMIAAGDLNGDGVPDVLVMFGNGPWVPYFNSCP